MPQKRLMLFDFRIRDKLRNGRGGIVKPFHLSVTSSRVIAGVVLLFTHVKEFREICTSLALSFERLKFFNDEKALVQNLFVSCIG